MNPRPIWLLGLALFGLALFGLAFAACGSSLDDKPLEETGQDGVPVVHIPARYAKTLGADLDTLVSTFDVAFVGVVTGEAEQRSELMAGGRGELPVSVFTVLVEASADAAVVGSTVEVEQLGGITTGGGTRTTQGQGPVRLLMEGDSPIEVGERYLFIVKEKAPGIYRASPMARFPIESGRLQPAAGWEDLGAAQEIAGLTVAQAMERVSRSAD
ncbi:MAG: hypothetical protein WD904_12575 [Dehalococcoidia bacterium]